MAGRELVEIPGRKKKGGDLVQSEVGWEAHWGSKKRDELGNGWGRGTGRGVLELYSHGLAPERIEPVQRERGSRFTGA